MSVRQGFLAIAVAVIVLLATIFWVMTLEVRNQGRLADAEARHYESYKLADELRQSSDDLTRMARTYVVTGDPAYETYFRRILAIRKGEAPRPQGYGGVYWDFVTASRELPGGDGEAVALQDLMRRMDFTAAEFAKLRESQENSDALVALEDRAMAAVKGRFADSRGQFTVPGEPDLALARELLHGPAYHQAKARIMAPIGEFTTMVEARTTREIEALRERAGFLVRAALGLMVLVVALLVAGLVFLQRRVVRPVVALAGSARRAESGDYAGRVQVGGDDEIAQLGRAFNQMSDAIQADIDTRDRTADELAQAREAADAANRAKSSFLANMSHELRTPMNAIIGYSEMLLEDAEDEGNEDVAADLRKIHGAGAHLLALINDVLDLSKIESGKMDLFLESFEVHAMVDAVVTTIETLIEKNGNRLTVTVDPAVGSMRADLTKVRQALFNLLSNAAKFTHGGEIGLTVRAHRDDGADRVTMSVSDSGIGIPPEKFDAVFDEFSQADDTTTRDYGGTGLGLPISRRFCQMMGGDITVASVVGEGSTFTINLPLRVQAADDDARAAAPAAGSSAAATAAPGEKRVVLVIDDDPNALDLIGRTLQGAGVRVVTASDGQEALRLARTLHPAAITLDVMMPGMDGWAVLEALKADPETRDIPVVMVTMTDDRALGTALGATEFLTKPVQRRELVRLLARHAPDDRARRALVVDDKGANREVLRRALENEGWVVSEAENGRAALEKVASDGPSLILLDLMMPVMDGFEFVVEMRKRDGSKSIPIVVVTAKDITEEDRRRLNGGVVGLIEKNGLDRESLLAQLRDLVDATGRSGDSRSR
jgi:signal transduction histidine kinase/DNA-binding response OmpR family regulator